jgi:hypothetical protein
MGVVGERIEILANRALVTRFGLDVERINALDDLWTSYLSQPHSAEALEADFPALQAIVGEMIHILTSLHEESKELEQLVLEFPSDLDREFELLVANHPAVGWVFENRPAQPLAQSVTDACIVMREEIPDEIATLAEKLARIAAGEFEPGDIRLTLKCAITFAGVGALVLAACASPGALIVLPAAVTAGAGIGGAVVTGVATIRGWSCVKPRPSPATS